MSVKPTTIVVTVTTAGTRIQVSTTAIYVDSVYFEGLRGNTGFHYIGDVLVSSTVHAMSVASAVGKSLTASSVATANRRIDLSKIYIDSSVNGEKCLVTYLQHDSNV